MNNILENYKKQCEIDKKNINNDLPLDNDEMIDNSKIDMKEYEKTLNKLRHSEDDMEQKYNKFHEKYIKISESQLKNDGNIIDEDIKIIVRRAYCPVCGKELVSQFPIIYNPFTKEKIAKYDCECGFTANLEYAYPRMVFIDKEGNEIKVFND